MSRQVDGGASDLSRFGGSCLIPLDKYQFLRSGTYVSSELNSDRVELK